MRRTLGAIILLTLVSGSADAALLSRAGGQAVYDTDQNITWLANATLAATNTFGVSGICTSTITDACPYGLPAYLSWYTAGAWVTAMNTANYLGVSNWRLPITVIPDASCSFQSGVLLSAEYNCTGSEMGHLYWIDGINSSHPGLLSNFRTDYYWSGTQVAVDPGQAWEFSFGSGFQAFSEKIVTRYAWSVSPGDNVVPIPPAAFLFPSALAALGRVRPKRVTTHLSN